MKSHLPSVVASLCITAALLLVAFFSTPPLLGSEKARPISSLSADERAKLPDSTEVTLKSGKTVTLGTLRAEHRARLERFSKAAALGKTVAGKLPPHPPTPMQTSPAVTGKAGAPTTPGKPVPGPTATAKAGSLPPGPSKPVIGTGGQAGSKISAPPSLVPFPLPLPPVPKDYVDFCKAANASACIYLPVNTHFTVFPPRSAEGPWVGVEEDPLINDESLCQYLGGSKEGGSGTDYPVTGCSFAYDLTQLVKFTPSGPVETSAACDSPAKYAVDPRGTIFVSASNAGGISKIYVYDTGPTPVTCLVQVWIGGK